MFSNHVLNKCRDRKACLRGEEITNNNNNGFKYYTEWGFWQTPPKRVSAISGMVLKTFIQRIGVALDHFHHNHSECCISSCRPPRVSSGPHVLNTQNTPPKSVSGIYRMVLRAFKQRNRAALDHLRDKPTECRLSVLNNSYYSSVYAL